MLLFSSRLRRIFQVLIVTIQWLLSRVIEDPEEQAYKQGGNFSGDRRNEPITIATPVTELCRAYIGWMILFFFRKVSSTIHRAQPSPVYIWIVGR